MSLTKATVIARFVDPQKERLGKQDSQDLLIRRALGKTGSVLRTLKLRTEDHVRQYRTT